MAGDACDACDGNVWETIVGCLGSSKTASQALSSAQRVMGKGRRRRKTSKFGYCANHNIWLWRIVPSMENFAGFIAWEITRLDFRRERSCPVVNGVAKAAQIAQWSDSKKCARGSLEKKEKIECFRFR